MMDKSMHIETTPIERTKGGPSSMGAQLSQDPTRMAPPHTDGNPSGR
jgi:hypothetical protein